jgi:hypothetical protein
MNFPTIPSYSLPKGCIQKNVKAGHKVSDPETLKFKSLLLVNALELIFKHD